jgi:hypothetical protein
MTTLQAFTDDYLWAIKAGNAPDYGTPTAVRADVSDYGTSIVVEFSDGRTLSPYFNQNDSEGDCGADNGDECGAPGECEFGWCGSARFEALRDADEWLDTMSGATDWSEGEWVSG